jgi:hypothetical protein
MNRLLFFSVLHFSLNAEAQESLRFKLAQTINNEGVNDIVLSDFNNNGSIDFVVANGIWNKPLPSKLFLNNGSGKFTVSPQDIGNSKSWCVQTIDFNSDNYADLLIVNGDWNNGDSSCIWLNTKNSTFEYLNVGFDIENSSAAAIGDFNNDNFPDVFMANHPLSDGSGGQDQIWLNNKEGGFIKSSQQLEALSPARRAKVADLNNDSHPDIIVLNGDINTSWMNNGNGLFSENKQAIGTGENIDFTVTDIDNDNDLDILVAKGAWGKSPKGIEVWNNDGLGNFNKTQNVGSNDCYGITSADLNKDTYADIIIVKGAEQLNQILLNNKAGGFYETNVDIGIGGNKVAATDLNKDNLIDIVVVGSADVKVYLQDATE